MHVDAAELPALVDEVRQWVRPGRTLTWWLGPSSEPPDIHARLLSLGLREPARGSVLHALACLSPPPPAPAGTEVRRVSTLDEYAAFMRLQWEVFGKREKQRRWEELHLAELWDAERRAGMPVSFLAFLDGRVAGTGRSIYGPAGSFLVAGATAHWARRRGRYRALVCARWDDAVARGAPVLVTEAMPDTSLPILLGLGFQEVCVVRRLEDPLAGR